MLGQNKYVNTAIVFSSAFTVSMAVSMAATTLPAFAQTRFSDVGSSYWASQYVQSLTANNAISGFPDGSFRPDDQMTRAQFAAVISGAFVSGAFPQPVVREPITFSDVPAGHWATGAISTAYSRGFLSGYPDGTFGLDKPITRLEVLVALSKGLGIEKLGQPGEVLNAYAAGLGIAQPVGETEPLLNAFSDQGEIPAWARDAIAAATHYQFVVNYPNVQQLHPGRNATRAEIVAMAHQAMVLTGKANLIASSYIAAPVGSTGPEAPLTESPSESPAEPVSDAPTEITADLIASLESDSTAVQQAAADSLIETGEEAVPELTNALEADSAQTRAIAAYALSEIGTEAQAATPALLEALRDDDELVRALATSALTNVGLDQPALTDVLVAAVQNESGLVKDIAADALLEMGGDAVPALGRLLENEATGSLTKQTAATLIGDIGSADDLGNVALQSAIPILVSTLNDRNSSVRQAAASALGDFGPLAELALPALSQALLGEDAGVSQTVAGTLLKIGPESIPTLTAALSSDNALVRLYAADALWTLTEDRNLILPTLISVAASSDFETRELATLGISYLGRQALPAVPLLNQLLGDRDSRTRSIAQTALEVVGRNSSPASTLGIISRQTRRLTRVPGAVPAVVRAVTRLWR